MAPIDDQTLDRLLSRHLSARLDGQLGRAEPAFRQALAAGTLSAADGVAADAVAEPSAHPADVDAVAPFPPRRAWGGGWVLGLAGAALAASLAALLVVPGINRVPPTPNGALPKSFAQTSPSRDSSSPGDGRPADQPTVRYVHNRTLDEGTFIPPGSNRPVRQVRRQQVEHIRYFDRDRGAWVEMVVPREAVEQLELDTY